MPEMVPADDPPVAAEPVGGRSALERILFGPLPAALIIIEALAVETRRGVNQIAAAGCTTACHGVPTRLSLLKGATVILAVVAFLMVWRYWRQHLGPRRPAGTVALAALMFFTITAAIAPWWGLATPLSLLALLIAIVAYQAAAGEADELSFPGVLRLRGVRVAVVVIADLRAVPARHPAIVATGDRRDARVGLASDLRLRRRRQRGAAGARRPRQRTAAGAPRRARRAGGRRRAQPLGDLRARGAARRRRRRAARARRARVLFLRRRVRRRLRGRAGRAARDDAQAAVGHARRRTSSTSACDARSPPG